MKQHNSLLLVFFIITQTMTTMHAMVRGGAVQAVQSAARSMHPMGVLCMATPVQAVQQVVRHQAVRNFGARNVMQDALSGASKNGKRSPEKPKIEASEQEISDLFAYKLLASTYKRYMYGKSIIRQGHSMICQNIRQGHSMVCRKYVDNIKPVVDKLPDTRPALLLLVGAMGVHELAKFKLKYIAGYDSGRFIGNDDRADVYGNYSLLMSDEKCLNIIMNGKANMCLLNTILEKETTKYQAWRMVTNNLDIILANFFSIFNKEPYLTKKVICELLDNESTRKKTAAEVLSNSILLMGSSDGRELVKQFLNYPEYKKIAQIILDNEKSLAQASPKELVKIELRKHGVGAAATEQIADRIPE